MTLDDLIVHVQKVGGGFAIFRQPHAESCSYVAQLSAPARWTSEMQEGFVIAPFEESESLPTLLIRPDERGEMPIPSLPLQPLTAIGDLEEGRVHYAKSFSTLHQFLKENALQKVVLARQQQLILKETVLPLPLFFSACRSNPQAFVAMWWTAQTGLWLVATPEVLIEREGDTFHTMAVAGTMPKTTIEGNETHRWSEKNRKEQQAVTDFIVQQLSGVGEQVEVTAPQSYVVGELMHLRTDIRFSSSASLYALTQRLHPTPAVCGTPSDLAKQAILAAEPNNRRYYSGFCGFLSPQEAKLYVTLRCMEISSERATLYAGGGILPESIMEDEWQETCRKLRPMLGLFQIDKA